MREEGREGLFGGEQSSVFSAPAQPKGLFEKDSQEEMLNRHTPAAASNNPFAVGTDAQAQPGEAPPENEVPAGPPARIRVLVSPDHLQAEVVVDEPEAGGLPPTREMLEMALAKAGVVSGLDEGGIAEVLKPHYEKPIVVAQGVAAEDGTDGICTELYPRSREATFNERADGSVNYKELGLICDLPAGTPICKVTPPTDGTSGTSVYGKELKARNGKKVSLPIGEGTRLSDDGLAVITTVSGNLVFRNGRFTVDEVFRIQDVDYDIGNITFSGDVQVAGDVQDGFEIHAGGNISLHGRVGSTVLESKGNISIEQGINGTGKAEITAAKTVTAGFIENCLVRAGESVVAGSIINSTVECEGDIDVTNKHGTICGGKITAFGSIRAKEIGNESNTPTLITVGITPRLLAERKKCQDQLNDVKKHIDEMTKNTLYIEKLVEQQRPVPPERLQLLQRTKVALPITERKRLQLEENLKEIDDKIEASTTSTITAKIIHPPTRITIGKLSMSINKVHNSARVYINREGELTVGSS